MIALSIAEEHTNEIYNCLDVRGPRWLDSTVVPVQPHALKQLRLDQIVAPACLERLHHFADVLRFRPVGDQKRVGSVDNY